MNIEQKSDCGTYIQASFHLAEARSIHKYLEEAIKKDWQSVQPDLREMHKQLAKVLGEPYTGPMED